MRDFLNCNSSLCVSWYWKWLRTWHATCCDQVPMSAPVLAPAPHHCCMISTQSLSWIFDSTHNLTQLPCWLQHSRKLVLHYSEFTFAKFKIFLYFLPSSVRLHSGPCHKSIRHGLQVYWGGEGAVVVDISHHSVVNIMGTLHLDLTTLTIFCQYHTTSNPHIRILQIDLLQPHCFKTLFTSGEGAEPCNMADVPAEM